MTAVATVFANQVIAVRHLRGRRGWVALARFQFHHVMMAFQAGAFGEPFGVHRKDPMPIVKPTVFFRPFFALFSIVRRVRCPLKLGGTPLPFMTTGTSEHSHFVWAGGTEKQ